MQSADAQLSSDNELCEHHHVRQHLRQPLWETLVSGDLQISSTFKLILYLVSQIKWIHLKDFILNESYRIWA